MPGVLVVDASVAVTAIVPGPTQVQVQALFNGWRDEELTLVAPVLWLYELTSALTRMVRFGQLAADEAREALPVAETLGIEAVLPDQPQIERALEWTLRLQRAAAYDSFYLALAETLDCELWTADLRLQRAVGLPWVRSLGASG